MSGRAGDAQPDPAGRIRAMGRVFTPETIAATRALFEPLQPRETAGVRVLRDLRYGQAERHRLDVFVPERAEDAQRAVLLFVHGGGFIGGDKSAPGSPFYDNVGRWAVRHGLIGVTMTYRLAPQHPWPAGSEDVGRAIGWLREHIGAHGGDVRRLFVMGQSAGAVHVAGYLAREQSPGHEGWRPAGAVLVSGQYDTRTMERNAFFAAYFGEDPHVRAGAGFLEPLARTAVPLMVVTAELDPPDFLRQEVVLLGACLEQRQQLPHVVHLMGHNHLSTVLHLNTADERFGASLRAFFDAVG